MHNRMVIFLSLENEQQVDWVVTDALGTVQQTALGGQLAQLEYTEEDEITLIFPAQDVLLTTTTLPKLSRYRLQQALPYALEEQLLEDVDLLHFACGPYISEQPLAVAVVKKQALETPLKHLQAAHLHAHAFVPEILAIPYTENQWQVAITANNALVRTGLYSGFSCDIQNVVTLLSLKLIEQENPPEQINVYQDEQYAIDFSTLTPLPIHQQEFPRKKMLEWMAAAIAQYPYINLLQGLYASPRKRKVNEKNKKMWQITAIAFSLCMGILFFSKLGSLTMLSYEHRHLQNTIENIYQYHFPEKTKYGLSDPKRKLEAKLKKQMAQSESNRFLLWLGYISKASSSLRMQNISFQNNQLTLDVTAASFGNLDEFISSLQTEGITVKQQNATTSSNNQVKAVLIIEGHTT